MWVKTPSVNLFPVSRFLSRHSGDKSSCTASIVDMALPRIQNEAGVREVTKEQLSGFVLMCAHHMRLNGAFAINNIFSPYSLNGGASDMTDPHNRLSS